MAKHDEQGRPASEAPEPTADEIQTPQQEPGAAPENIQPETTPPSDLQQHAGRVADVGEYEKMLAAALEPQKPQEEAAPGEEPAPQDLPPTEPPAAAPTEQPTEQPPAVTDPPADPPKPTETPTEDKIPDRIRLGGMSEKSRAKLVAATMLAKAEGIEFDEAYARLYPSAPAAAGGGSPDAPQPGDAPDGDRSLDTVRKEILAQKQAIREARRAMDVEAEFAAEDKMEELLAEEDKLAEAQARAQETRLNAEHEAFVQAVDAAEAEAKGYYPAMTDEAHPIHAEAKRIWDTMEKMKNPLLKQPEAIRDVYAMAANALGIPPVDPQQATPTQSHTNGTNGVQPKPSSASATPRPQAVQQTAVRRPTPAGSPAPGSARTTPVEPTAQAVIGKIRTVADYEKAVASLTA